MAEEENKTTVEEQETTQLPAENKNTDAGQGKTFTQAELDKIISDRIARERKNLPDETDLKAFKEWKKSQQTEAEKAAEREKELAEARTEAENLRRENAVIKAGVSADDADYVLFKVGKMEGDFENNLKSFLVENEKFTDPNTRQIAGAKHGASKSSTADGVEAAFLKKNPDLKID